MVEEKRKEHAYQPIAKDLDEKNYARAAVLVKYTGLKINSYKQYQK